MRTTLHLAALSAALATVAAAQSGSQCGNWGVFPSPNPAPANYNQLFAVSAASASEAWAVGSQLVAAPNAPMVFRWDGKQWNDTALPTFDPTVFGVLIDLDDVVAFPGDRMWGIGVASGRVLAIQWNSGAWQSVVSFELSPQSVYPFGLRTATTKAADGVSPDDLWIAGRASGFGNGSMSIVPMLVHWDGAQWTEVHPPWVVDDVIVLEDIVALASNDVWAVGWGRGSSIPTRAIVYHWDGTSWRHVLTPAFSIYMSHLEAVAAVGPNDIWAVGDRPGGALLMHWDGSSWTLVDGPFNETTLVGAAAATASDDVWAIATLRDTFLHWDGTAWTEVVPPAVPGAVGVARADLAAVGACDVWSVGDWSDGSTFGSGWQTKAPLVERLLSDPRTYCTAKQNSCGGLPSIASSGAPSATSGSGFMVSADNTKANKFGLLLYTESGPGNAPFSGGTLCISASGLKRSTAVVDATGTPGQCNGTDSIDMNAFAVGALGGNPLPSLTVPGTQVNCQFWGRDTIANGALLSDALEYFVGA